MASAKGCNSPHLHVLRLQLCVIVHINIETIEHFAQNIILYHSSCRTIEDNRKEGGS